MAEASPQGLQGLRRGSLPAFLLPHLQEARMTRFQKQQEIESLIVQFSGDAMETSELLAALLMGLANRIDRDKWADVDHEFGQLKEALEELDRTYCDPDPGWLEDLKYDEWAQAQIDQEEVKA